MPPALPCWRSSGASKVHPLLVLALNAYKVCDVPDPDIGAGLRLESQEWMQDCIFLVLPCCAMPSHVVQPPSKESFYRMPALLNSYEMVHTFQSNSVKRVF